MKQHTLKTIISLVFIFWVFDVNAENNPALMTAITNNVQVVCQSPPDQGKHWSINMKGDGGVHLGLNFLKDAQVEAKGEAEFNKEEWEGVQRVLQKQKYLDNSDYRNCVQKLTTLFLDKFSADSGSTDNASVHIEDARTTGDGSDITGVIKGGVHKEIKIGQ